MGNFYLISGYVEDEMGELFIGVFVLIKGIIWGIVIDLDGWYEL